VNDAMNGIQFYTMCVWVGCVCVCVCVCVWWGSRDDDVTPRAVRID